jgi:glycerophosphoryl diester phosphodiesterase
MENTLPSFALALDEGTDAIELDVHATVDGMVVVHHDPDVAAAAGAVRRRAIADMTWDDLLRLELTGGGGIPALADVLELVGTRARVYVEIKGIGIERLVADVIGGSRAECAVHSFDHDAIARMRTIAPEIPRGLLLDAGDRRARHVEALIAQFEARDIWPHRQLVNERLVRETHRAGARLIVWTVNDGREARRLAELGADALCTDDVPAIRTALTGDAPEEDS